MTDKEEKKFFDAACFPATLDPLNASPDSVHAICDKADSYSASFAEHFPPMRDLVFNRPVPQFTNPKTAELETLMARYVARHHTTGTDCIDSLMFMVESQVNVIGSMVFEMCRHMTTLIDIVKDTRPDLKEINYLYPPTNLTVFTQLRYAIVSARIYMQYYKNRVHKQDNCSCGHTCNDVMLGQIAPLLCGDSTEDDDDDDVDDDNDEES